jgi:LuxR family transcriptional regulator, glucitol operon activator
MSNVHEYLEESSRKVLRSMLCVQGPHSQAELSFLNRVDASQLQEALHQLLTTNMVVMTSTASGSTFESKYELAELARSYLLKHHPISDQEHQEFTRMLKVLTAATDSIRREQSLDPYSWNSIATRSQSDLIVAKYLTDAMRSAGRNQKEALNLVTKAKALAPEYFEVHRVEALIEAWSGNIAAARSAYEKAIELEPQSAPLRVWFGRFVIKSLQDPESALEQFEFAQQIDPTAFDVQLELARANVWLKRFEEAESIVSALLSRSDTGVRKQKKVFDVALQMHLKNAEALMLEFQLEGALEILEELKQTYLDCPEPLHDAQMRDKLSRSITIGRKCLARIVDPFLKSKAEEYLDWLMTELEGGNHEKVPTTRKAKS